MEKNMGSASGNPQPVTLPPSAPSAPPSYEEAVENAARTPGQPNIPPYPVAPTAMPLPTHNPPPIQMPIPMSCPPNYSGPSEPPTHSWTRYNADPATAPQPDCHRRVIYEPVICSLGPNPTKKTICPTCHATIKTTTISDHQPSAHLCCIVLCLLGCCLCSCLPYCMSSFTSVHHFCPKCKSYIGTWKG